MATQPGLTFTSSFGPHGGSTLTAVEPSPYLQNRLDAFYTESNGQVSDQAWVSDGSGWNPPTSLGAPSGGGFSGIPGAVWWQDGSRVDVFAAGGANNHLYQNCFPCPGGWLGWQDLGDNAIGDVSTTAQMTVLGSPPRIDVFFTDWNGGNIIDKAWISGGGWAAPTNLGKPSVGLGSYTPAATWWQSNQRLDVYVIGQDNQLYQNCWNCQAANQWRGWLGIGECSLSGPGVAAYPSAVQGVNRIDVFFMHCYDGYVYQKTWGSDQGGWITASLGGGTASYWDAPGSSWWMGDQRIDVMVRASSTSHILHNCFPCPSTWRGWLDDLTPATLSAGPGIAHT